MTVTKIDAARRQLEIAVLLYFNERDPLAIHTLAAAAEGVLDALIARAGKTTPLYESLASNIPPDLEKEIRQALRGPQNFLKHADRDPDSTMEFSPDFTELILYNSVVAYMRLTGDQSPYLGAFVRWFGINHPEWYSSAGPEFLEMLKAARKLFAGDGRMSFLENFLAQNSKIRS